MPPPLPYENCLRACQCRPPSVHASSACLVGLALTACRAHASERNGASALAHPHVALHTAICAASSPSILISHPSSSAEQRQTSGRPAGAKGRPFRSEGSSLHHGARRKAQEPRFQFFESLRACRDGTNGTAMRKGAASARGSGSTTPAQRNLLSARPNSDLDAAELQKDGSGLQAGGCFPPPRRRSDRCHRRRGRTTELGPRSTSTAATDRHCFLLAPATVAPAHSVQQGRRRSPCFALLLLSSSCCRSCSPRMPSRD